LPILWRCKVVGVLRVAHLGDQIANKRFGDVARQVSDGLPSDQVQLLRQLRSEIRNLLQCGEAGLADALGGGVPALVPAAEPVDANTS